MARWRRSSWYPGGIIRHRGEDRASDIDDHAACCLVMDVAQGAVDVDEIATRLDVVPVSSPKAGHLDLVEAEPEAGR